MPENTQMTNSFGTKNVLNRLTAVGKPLAVTNFTHSLALVISGLQIGRQHQQDIVEHQHRHHLKFFIIKMLGLT